MSPGRIIFVDDEEHLRIAAGQTFQLADLSVDVFDGAAEALKKIDRGFDGVVVTDIRMPEMDGIQLLRSILTIDPAFPVVLVTGHGDVELAVECMREGAYDFVEKPYEPTKLVSTVQRALEKRRLTLENRTLHERVAAGGQPGFQLSGNSDIIENVRARLGALARTETDVLITGDTGTGKDVAARMLHEQSERRAMPFVHINCAALPSDLVEIELFGHEVGAFPAAMRSRYGKFEHARGGTVFLDEIESLALPVQAKLLHAIQERLITRLGSNEPVALDVRFIAASKNDLKAEIGASRFRSDLYYRLAGAQLHMPSLSERCEDVAGLFVELAHAAASRHDKAVPEVPGAVLSSLTARDWPGNVRELKNVAERFVLGLDLEIDQSGSLVDDGPLSLADQLGRHEQALIVGVLASNHGNLKSTYEALKISRKALYEKMQKYGLKREKFTDE